MSAHATTAESDSLLQQMTTALLITDSRGHIRYANAAAESLLAGSSRRLRGAPLESLFRYSSLDFSLLASACEKQQTLSDSDVIWVLHDGRQMTVELMVSPYTLADGLHGSEQVQLLELRQVDMIRRISQEQVQQHQLAAAQQLIRGLAHEIKNPLGGIRGAAQLLELKLEDDATKEYTSLIIRQADRLRELVDRLLGPNQPGKRALVNLHQLVERCVQIVELDKPAAVVLSKDYDPSLPPLMMVEYQIEQVLLNLIQNAVYAVGEQGHICVRTRIVHQETIYGKRHRRCLVLSVVDDGPGVPTDIKDTLFYPLVSGREGGTGLGLSIAQSLVHQHAGKIELSSRPGHTEFTLYLPYEEVLYQGETR